MSLSWRRPVARTLALALLVSCGDGTAPPPPTLFQARLVSPSGAEGALLAKLTGPVVEVTAPSGALILRSRGDTTWVFLALRTPGSLSFTVRTPEGAGEPTPRVLQVVAPDDHLRPELSGYRLELDP